MWIRRLGFGLVAVFAVGLGGGCKKAEQSEAAPPAQTVARVHWLGFDHLATETNAARFMAIWNEPESKKLAAQTLDKLARFLAGEPPPTNAPGSRFGDQSRPKESLGVGSPITNNLISLGKSSALWRPLLDDLLQAESYLEVREPVGQPGERALAIRLKPERAALWATNIPAAFAVLTNEPTIRRARSDAPYLYQLQRSGDWTLLGLASQPTNTLLADLADRIQRDHAPFSATATNFWLYGEIDLSRIASALALDWKPPTNTPTVSFNAIGEDKFIITRAGLSFPRPLPLALDPWNIPTNLVAGRLISFTAARNLAPWLAGLKLFSDFPPAEVPSQFYVWGDKGLPFHTYLALPANNATHALALLAKPIMDYANPRILTNCGTISVNATNGSLSAAFPHCDAFLEAEPNSSPQFLYGGFGPRFRPSSMPPEIVAHILEGTNLVYFDWETAGEMLVHWRYLDDVYRIVFDNRGPRLNNTVSLAWIATNLTNLSHCVTEVRLEQSNRLSFVRKSTVGFDGIELDALANWLELPEFPRGLTTLMNTNPAPPPILLKMQRARKKG